MVGQKGRKGGQERGKGNEVEQEGKEKERSDGEKDSGHEMRKEGKINKGRKEGRKAFQHHQTGSLGPPN